MKDYSEILFKEDWSSFKPGHLSRDNTAKGEYMARVVPDNPNGWYEPASAGWGAAGKFGQDTSAWEVKDGAVIQHVHATSEGFCLTRGEELWRDYSVASEIEVRGIQMTGLMGRYQTSRDFYTGIIENGILKIAKRVEGVWTVLAHEQFSPEGEVVMELGFKGPEIRLSVNNKTVLQAEDGSFSCGGIGLIAHTPASFKEIRVHTYSKELVRIREKEKKKNIYITSIQQKYPAAELALEIDIKGLTSGREIRFADFNNDGRSEILLALPKKVKGKTWDYTVISKLTAVDLAGNILWQKGDDPEELITVTEDLPFQTADRGEGMETVTCFKDSLEVIDAQTGETVKQALTPVSPVMEDYWDEIQQYFGSGHGDDIPNLIPDAIRLCSLTGKSSCHDILMKDRYHNAWGIDGTSLEVLWHHQCNTGHYPFAWDPDSTGYDTVILGFSRLDHKGNLTGRLVLGDHPDACFAYKDEFGIRHILHPSGEAGHIDELSDGRLSEIHLGHVQHLSVANFLKDLPDLERIIVTYHGGQGIIVMMDCENRIVRKKETVKAGAVCQPVNWTGDGEELIAFSPVLEEGGLWNSEFELAVPLPVSDRPEKCMEIHDILGLGVDQIVVWDDERLQVYKPSKAGKGKYRPIRPFPNMSNYQVNYSIPKWEK